MAAMRMGCLFSQPPISRSCKGAIALQRQFAGSWRPRPPSGYRITLRNTWAKRWPRANCFTSGLEQLEISYVPSSANFVLAHFGERAVECATLCANAAFWFATAATKLPGRAHHRGNARPNPHGAGGDGGDLAKMSNRFWYSIWTAFWWMCRESYRETIAQTVRHFTGEKAYPRRVQGFKNPRRMQRRLEALASLDSAKGVNVPFEDSE